MLLVLQVHLRTREGGCRGRFQLKSLWPCLLRAGDYTTGLAFITTWSSLNHRKSRTVTSSLESSNPTPLNFLAFLLQRFIVAELLGRTLVPCGCQLLRYFSKWYLVPYCSADFFLYRSTALNFQQQGYLTVSPSTDSVSRHANTAAACAVRTGEGVSNGLYISRPCWLPTALMAYT